MKSAHICVIGGRISLEKFQTPWSVPRVSKESGYEKARIGNAIKSAMRFTPFSARLLVSTYLSREELGLSSFFDGEESPISELYDGDRERIYIQRGEVLIVHFLLLLLLLL